MRKLITVGLCLGCFSLPPLAREMAARPKLEPSAAIHTRRFIAGVNANGWNASVAGKLNNWFGIAGDFSGAYKTENGVSFNNYTYAVGPVVSYRHNETFTPFAHFLLGGCHASVAFDGVSGSNGGFA